VVNEDFANRFLKGMDPLQQRVLIEQVIPGLRNLGPQSNGRSLHLSQRQVWGISRRLSRGGTCPRPVAIPDVTIGVRTAQDPAAMIKTIAAVGILSPADRVGAYSHLGPGEG